MGIPPLKRFLIKFGLGKGVPGPHLYAKFDHSDLKNLGLQPQKSQKKSQKISFWYKFAPKGKFRGSTEKVEYRCTTTNLSLCNDTIIVLKITLLHSVSIITNFVIPKRDKRTDRQKTHHTFSFTAGAWPTIPTILSMVIEEVRPIFEPPPQLFLIRSVVLPLGAFDILRETALTTGKCL